MVSFKRPEMSAVKDLKAEVRVLTAQLEQLKVDGKRPEDEKDAHMFDYLASKLDKAKSAFLEKALSVDSGEEATVPEARTDENHRYSQVSLLMHSMANLPNFNGHTPDLTTRFIGQVRQLHKTIDIDFATFLGATVQKFSIPVFQVYEEYIKDKQIKSIEELKTFLMSQYGGKTSLCQKMEQIMTKPKAKSCPWPKFAADTNSELSTLENQLLEARRHETNDPTYRLTSADCFELIKKLKLLQEIRSDSTDLYKAITSESDNLRTASAMAQRAEVLKTQSLGNHSQAFVTTKKTQNKRPPNRPHGRNGGHSNPGYRNYNGNNNQAGNRGNQNRSSGPSRYNGNQKSTGGTDAKKTVRIQPNSTFMALDENEQQNHEQFYQDDATLNYQ